MVNLPKPSEVPQRRTVANNALCMMALQDSFYFFRAKSEHFFVKFKTQFF